MIHKSFRLLHSHNTCPLTSPFVSGMVYQPRISDADNNMVFGLESAVVTLANAQDSGDEFITVPNATISDLEGRGINVSGETNQLVITQQLHHVTTHHLRV